MTTDETAIVLTGFVEGLLMPDEMANKNTRSRMEIFRRWMVAENIDFHNPDLGCYRDHLTLRYKASSVSNHLSTVRACYRSLLRSNDFRNRLYSIAQGGPADRKAFVDEVIKRIENGIDPDNSRVKAVTVQDRPDSEHLRLTREQAEALLAAPGLEGLQSLRDTAVLALMLCTGIREGELCALDVGDLRQALGGELALHVRSGKGDKAPLIPYGDLDWCLAIVDKWLQAAGIKSGPVFRGLYKGGRKLRPGRLSVRAVEYIVGAYPVMVRGELAQVRPHDLRRTYARRQYKAGLDLVAIQQNLGHKDIKTTLGYIGNLNGDDRRAKGAYTYDLSKLKAVGVRLGLEGEE